MSNINQNTDNSNNTISDVLRPRTQDILTDIPSSIDRGVLIKMMRECMQTKNQSVYQHGISVWQHFIVLIEDLMGRKAAPEWWRIPKWAYMDNILGKIPPLHIIEEYAIYHDCGKPFSRVVDDEGRVHFPNHAAVSEKIWLTTGGDPMAAKLIGMDMDAHLLRADGIEEFASRPEAILLLLMALAEVHSNAELFGGQNSDSFKIKAKHLEKRGRQVMEVIATNSHKKQLVVEMA